MSEIRSKISLWSNNSSLEQLFCGQTLHEQTTFVAYHENNDHGYVLVLIDLDGDLTDVSQKIISIVESCRENKQKLLISLLHPEKIDVEKNIYFGRLLEGMSAEGANFRLVIVKDLYQPGLVKPVTWFDTFVLETLLRRQIDITSKGEGQYYPLSIHDFVCAILKIFYLSGTAGKTFWILGDTITDLELAYLIKKKLENVDDQDLEINAESPSTDQTSNVRSLGNESSAILNWEPTDDFYTAMTDIVRRLSEDKDELSQKITKVKYTGVRKHLEALNQKLQKYTSRFHTQSRTAQSQKFWDIYIWRSLEWTLFFVVFSYFCVTLTFAGSIYFSLKNSEASISSLRKGNIASSVKYLASAKLFTGVGETSYGFISPLINLASPDTNSKNHNLITLTNYINASLGNIQQTYTLGEAVYKGLAGSSQEARVEDTSLALKSNLSQVYQSINLIKLLALPGKLPQVVESKITQSEEYKNLPIIEQQAQNVLKAIDLLPAALAGENARNIVILFQNNQDLHSAGGRIDYVQVLVVERGRVVSSKLYGAAEIDSLSTEVVPPPPLLAQLFQQEHWKMQDLNYNPDFSQTSANISWYLEKTLKFKPDAIIAVNNSLIEDYLDQVGGMSLNGNMVTTGTIKASTGLDQGQYKELIVPFVQNITEGKAPLLTLGRVVAKGVAENQILYWSADPTVQKNIVNQSYSGTIVDRGCHSALSGLPGCVSHTTYLGETSISLVGVSNRYQREVVHKVTLEEAITKHEYRLGYQLISGVPSSDKQNIKIFQLVVTSPSTIQNISVDGQTVATPGLTKVSENSLDRYQIPLVFNEDKSREISIRFELPILPIDSYPLGYSLTEYRQPGTYDKGVALDFSHPEGLKPSTITAPVVLAPNQFTYTYPPKTSTFGVSFIPNQ